MEGPNDMGGIMEGILPVPRNSTTVVDRCRGKREIGGPANSSFGNWSSLFSHYSSVVVSFSPLGLSCCCR
jgi:hypothetical protein